MVIFMPYYRQYNQHYQSRSRPLSLNANSSNNNTTTVTTTDYPSNGYKFASRILCRILFSVFLLIIVLFLFQLSINNESNEIEGSYIIASILLIIAMITFIQTCHKIRRYHIIMDTRRRLMQRLHERQQAYDLAVSLNNSENRDSIRNVNNDLPTYKELFPSHRNITNNDTDFSSSSSLPPPSYDDYITTLAIQRPISRLPIPSLRSHRLSLPNTSIQSQSNPMPCIWITDQTRRPVCIRGTVTYV